MANTPVYVDLGATDLTGHVMYVYGMAGLNTNNPNDDGFDNISGPDLLTELNFLEGLYRTYIDEALDGWHFVIIRDGVGGTIYATGWIKLSDTTNGHYVTFDIPDEVLDPAGSTLTGGSVGTGQYYNTVRRNSDDENDLYFEWPSQPAGGITARRSLNGGLYEATAGAVSFLRAAGNAYEYRIAYNSADRPADGIAMYEVTDGTDTRYIPFSVDTATVGGGLAGPGSRLYTETITIDSVPEQWVDVWVTTDDEGTNVIAGTLQTDVNGEVTFALDPGTYYLWAQKDGLCFDNPKTIEVT